jgi:hypothetical protein
LNSIPLGVGSGRVQKVKVNWLAFQSQRNKETKKQTHSTLPTQNGHTCTYVC